MVNFQTIMRTPPRSLLLTRWDREKRQKPGSGPLNLTDRDIDRMAPLVSMAAQGQIPIDRNLEPVIARTLMKQARRAGLV